MTTNQTIDGVSRRMLTALLCHVSELENRALVDELRALLDAPACKRCNGSGWIDNLRPVGTQAMDCPECNPSTQLTNAQRRAADYKERQAFNDWAWNKEGEAIGRMDGQAAAIEAWHARAKLAEQPAPVAVVLPERREIGPNYPYLSDLDIEWNTCLDEVTRLNTK